MIISSSVVSQRRHRDGRRLVLFAFTDSFGGVHHVRRWLLLAHDVSGVMDGVVVELTEALVQRDLDGVIQGVKDGLLQARAASNDNVMAVTTRWATQSQVQQALFEWFNAVGAVEARMLVPAIDSMTDGQISALGVNQATVGLIREKAVALSKINNLVVAIDG